MRRGLTLVEVVASVVLLALVGTACVSFLRDAARDLAAARSSRSHEAVRSLGAAADAILAREPMLAVRLRDRADGADLDWPDGSERPPIRVTMGAVGGADSDAEAAPHAWLLFEGDGVAVARWVRLPPSRERSR